MQCHDFICQCGDKQDGWVTRYAYPFTLSLPLAHRSAFRKTAVTVEALTERALKRTSALIHDRFIHRLFEARGSCLLRNISVQNIKEARGILVIATSVDEKHKPVRGIYVVYITRCLFWKEFSSVMELRKLHRRTDGRARTFFLTGCEIVTKFAICSPIKSTELRTSTAHLMPPRHLTLHGSVANSISLTLFLQIVLQIDVSSLNASSFGRKSSIHWPSDVAGFICFRGSSD